MRESLRASAAGMHSDRHLRLTQPRVFARPKEHITRQRELAASASDAPSDLCDANYWALGETDESFHKDGQTRSSYSDENVSDVARQVKVREIEVIDRAFKDDNPEPSTAVHPPKQVLEPFEYFSIHDVERRMIEDYSPERRRLFDDPNGRS